MRLYDAFPDNLRNLRKKNKLTQKQLANELDISKQSIQNYETGRSFPTDNILTQLATELNVTVEELIIPIEDTETQRKIEMFNKIKEFEEKNSLEGNFWKVYLLEKIDELTNFEIKLKSVQQNELQLSNFLKTHLKGSLNISTSEQIEYIRGKFKNDIDNTISKIVSTTLDSDLERKEAFKRELDTLRND
ncbi:helix-turn-helix domain-containing protein [Vagococcus sp. JNUCC 83]